MCNFKKKNKGKLENQKDDREIATASMQFLSGLLSIYMNLITSIFIYFHRILLSYFQRPIEPLLQKGKDYAKKKKRINRKRNCSRSFFPKLGMKQKIVKWFYSECEEIQIRLYCKRDKEGKKKLK